MNYIINQKLVDNLYNPKKSGIHILKNCISLDKLNIINNFIKNNKHNFEEKKEKNIKNNQFVALLYRGPYDIFSLENTIFKDILITYKDIRDSIANLSNLPFAQGNSLEVKLIYYPISDLGVENHKDLSSNVNLVVFFNLEGSNDVKTYIDKQSNNPVSHLITSGDISLMRAPRLNENIDIRPYHGVEKVNVQRTVLVVREINEELEKLTNKDNWRGF